MVADTENNNLQKCRYHFDQSTGILFKVYFGDITLKDIVETWDQGIENNLIPADNKGFIVDYRKARILIGDDDRPGIAEYFKDHLDVFGGKKIAVVTEDYRDIIQPILVMELDEGYSSRPFSTIEAATGWILD